MVNFGYLFNTISTNYSKNNIIEPYSCLFRIALLQYKSDGTKLSISDNSISYTESSYIQGIIRTMNSDKRDDLHNLFNPIYYSTQWYKIDNPNNLFIFSQSLLG